jgi:hypothetical protein
VVDNDEIAKTSSSSSGSWWAAFKNMLRKVFVSDQTTTATANKNEVKVVVSQLDAEQEADTDVDSDSEEDGGVIDDDAAAIVIEQTQQLTPGMYIAILHKVSYDCSCSFVKATLSKSEHADSANSCAYM